MNRRLLPIVVLMISNGALGAQDIPLSKILIEKEGWRKVPVEFRDITYLEGLPDGNVAVNMNGAHGTLTTRGEFLPGPDVLVVRTAKTARATNGIKYVIDADGKTVACFKEGAKRIDSLKLAGLKAPACLALWPDEGHLVIGEADGAYLWAVRIEKDGSFGPGDRYYSLRTVPNEKMHVSAMVMDAGFLLYACTPRGIQVFDPTGRLSGVIAAPSKDALTAITIGGEKGDTLFVATGDRIYARRIQGKAAYTLKREK
jgi:sugar lactone lactonase YvrE